MSDHLEDMIHDVVNFFFLEKLMYNSLKSNLKQQFYMGWSNFKELFSNLKLLCLNA